MQTIKVNISWNENYGAVSSEIPGCVATHKTLEGVKKEFEETVAFHLEGMKIHGDTIPECLQVSHVFVYELDAQALLRHFNGVVSFAALSCVTGINQKLLGHYASGIRHPRFNQRRKIVEGLHRIGSEFVGVV